MQWWRDLSVKAKFLAGTGVILIIAVISAIFNMVISRSLEATTQALNHGYTINETLIERENQHLQWVSTLAIYLADREAKDLDVQTDPTQCAFGKWYYGDGKKEMAVLFPGLVAALAAIEAPHKELHLSAVTIAEQRKSGQQAAAEATFKGKTLPALAGVQKEFKNLRTAVSSRVQGLRAAYDERQQTSKTVTAALSALTIAAVLMLGYVLFTSILKPIQSITAFSRECLRGEDGSLHLPQRDEFGVLADNLTTLMDHLNEQLAFSQGVLHGITVPCSVFSPKDTTLFTNQPMLDLIEHVGTPESVLGKSSGEFILGQHGQETLSSKALRENRALSVEREFTTKQGRTRHARISSAPFYATSGQLLGTLSIWVDLTEVVAKQKAIEESNSSISKVAASARGVANEVSSASSSLLRQVGQASTGSSVQRDRLGETVTAMTEMNCTVLEVASNAAKASETTAQAHIQAQEGADVVENVLAAFSK